MQILKIKRKKKKQFNYNNTLDELRKIISDHRINFLIGSGFSCPLLEPQGNIEDTLKLIKPNDKNYNKIKAYLLWNYFLRSIYPLLQLNLDVSPQKDFVHCLKDILSNNDRKLLTKQINIFTTNFDPLLELGFNKKDDINYNDGLLGKTVPVFSLENYKEFKGEQITYNYDREILPEFLELPNIIDKPTLNIFKLHGSLTWKRNVCNNNIEYVDFHVIIYDFYRVYKDIFNTKINEKLDKLLEYEGLSDKKVKKYLDLIFHKESDTKRLDKKEDTFFEEFHNTFMIVDPFRRKFTSELLELHYFKLLRVFANELNKENAALIVFGSSLKDDHLRNIIEHELKNNALNMYIFCYDSNEAEKFASDFKVNNKNIKIVSPVKSTYNLKDFNDLLASINKGKV